MKTVANFESILNPLGHSFTYHVFDHENPNDANSFWHYHPEIELVYISGGSGKRQIGMHLSNYFDGDLILIGSQVPHSGFTESFSDFRKEIVIQFKPDFLGNAISNVHEFKLISSLFERAKQGVVFSGEIKKDVGLRMEGIQFENQLERLLTLIKILNDLALSNERTLLNAESYSLSTNFKDNERIKLIFNYIRQNFSREVSLPDIASIIHMTPQSFCRFFKKSTKKTFVQFLNEYRMNHAIKLLIDTDLDIKTICYETGFNNLSNFFRVFKRTTGFTPEAYRKNLTT